MRGGDYGGHLLLKGLGDGIEQSGGKEASEGTWSLRLSGLLDLARDPLRFVVPALRRVARGTTALLPTESLSATI